MSDERQQHVPSPATTLEHQPMQFILGPETSVVVTLRGQPLDGDKIDALIEHLQVTQRALKRFTPPPLASDEREDDGDDE